MCSCCALLLPANLLEAVSPLFVCKLVLCTVHGAMEGTPTIEGVRKSFASHQDLAVAKSIQELLQEWAAATSAQQDAAAARVAGQPPVMSNILLCLRSGSPLSHWVVWVQRLKTGSRRPRSRRRGRSLQKSMTAVCTSWCSKSSRQRQQWRRPCKRSEVLLSWQAALLRSCW